MKIWYIFCFLLFIDSIIILINESYDVTYHLEYDSNWMKSISYVGCHDLNNIFKNEIEIKSNQLENATNIYYDYLINYDYYNNSYVDTRYERELFLRKLKSKDYIVYRGFLCIIIFSDKNFTEILNRDDLLDEKELTPQFRNSMKEGLLINSEKAFKLKFAYNNETFNFFKSNYNYLRFNQIIIQNLDSPYSNCTNEAPFRFKCLNDCNRKNNKLSKYYYHANEIDSNQLIKIKFNYNDKEMKDNETQCIEKCNKQVNNCKLIYFKEKKNIHLSNTTIFRAYPLISEFDYWIQFIGLICLITYIIIANLFIKLVQIIKKRIKTNIRIIKIRKYKIKINIKKCLNYLEYLILLILIVYLFSQIYMMINEYFNRRDYPIKKQITTTELKLKSINLIICIPLKFISNYKIKTFAELENDTSKLFNQHVKKIYQEYQNKKIDYKLNKSKILFYDEKRCFQIEINPYEYKYRDQLLISRLIILFKYNIYDEERDEYNYRIHLLSNNENLNYNTYQIKGEHLFIKREIKRSKLNQINRCNDSKDVVIKEDLMNKYIIREYINNNQNLSVHSIIDKDKLSNDQWTKLFLNYTDFLVFEKYFLMYLIKNYSYPKNCFETEYRNGAKFDNLFDNKLKIELNYDVIKEIEEEPSIYKLLMSILNIQSILFGFNFFNIITIILNYKIIKFKYNKLLIYLICSIGFSYHFWFIFNEIINGDLIYSQYYKQEQTFKIPDVVFCIKYDQNLINLNHKLTYKYLDKITNQLNINLIINEIKYLNKSNNWIKFNISNIDTFYFLDQKCFEIKFNLEYKLDQFDPDKKNEIIKLYPNYFSKESELYFLNKIPNTNQFSKTNRYFSYGYDMTTELMEIDYEDKFNLIKNPSSIIYGLNEINNVDKYLNNLIDNFKINYNLVTLNLPLNNSNSLVIDDQLFDQLYLQIQNHTDYNQPINPNFKRIFINNNVDYNNHKYLLIDLIFFKKIIKITNEDNYTKLILNLLNLVSLWYDIGLFDLEIYFDLFIIKIKIVFLFLYNLLIKIDNHLYRKL